MERGLGMEGSDLLLALYRTARESSIGGFQEAALRLIKPLLQFDGAIWGAGKRLDAGVAVHLAHLHEVSPERLVEWESLNPQDRVIPAVVAEPGWPKLFHSPTLFAGRCNGAMRDFTRRAGWQMSMVTAFLAPHGRNAQWVSLYRPDADHQYSEYEQRLARLLMPHLVEALTINRSLHLRSTYGDDGESEAFIALCDRGGMIHYADAGFVETLAREWQGFDGGDLPDEVLALVTCADPPKFAGKRIRLESRSHGGFVFLRARPKLLFDSLSPRERMVALEYAKGRSHKEIAKSLALSPATVRQHLSAVYSKLEVHDKAQLAVVLVHASELSSRRQQVT